nr:hypothetical protein [Pseudomonas syringae]
MLVTDDLILSALTPPTVPDLAYQATPTVLAAADMPTAYDFSTLDKDYCIPHPTSGELSFGYISMYESRNLTLPGGEIYLRVGKHFGFSSGFGVNHIWQGHGHELAKSSCKTIQEVSAFVAGILSAGAQIYCEGYQTRDGHRLTVVRNAKGCAILSPQEEAERGCFYSVVTAYKILRRRPAIRVGTLKPKKAP